MRLVRPDLRKDDPRCIVRLGQRTDIRQCERLGFDRAGTFRRAVGSVRAVVIVAKLKRHDAGQTVGIGIRSGPRIAGHTTILSRVQQSALLLMLLPITLFVLVRRRSFDRSEDHQRREGVDRREPVCADRPPDLAGESGEEIARIGKRNRGDAKSTDPQDGVLEGSS